MTLVALDLFCGGGGAARGLIDAGFDEVVGHDKQGSVGKSYPGEFHCGDVLDLTPDYVARFDFVWASPPCQRFSIAARLKSVHDHYPDLCESTRALIARHPLTCIENVPDAPIRADLKLTGAMFDLLVTRDRIFELSFPAPFDLAPRHTLRACRGELATVAGHGWPSIVMDGRRLKVQDMPSDVRKAIRSMSRVGSWRKAMGIPDGEMTKKEIAQAVPPAYAEYIGRRAIEQIRNPK